jgi:hypothetical protein
MFQQALIAAGPHPDIPPAQSIFAPLIGSWHLEVTWYRQGSPIRRDQGEWHFAWVLEGRAVQDVWIVPPRQRRQEQSAALYEYGTSIRFYDTALGAWRSTWIGPMRAVVRTFVARGEAKTVVLETDASDAERLRWIFSQIERDTFTWQNFAETAEGAWTLVQDFKARRTRKAAMMRPTDKPDRSP